MQITEITFYGREHLNGPHLVTFTQSIVGGEDGLIIQITQGSKKNSIIITPGQAKLLKAYLNENC